ncbi:MAG: hypothetical protein QOE87_1544 [Gaiellales bacterium]|nr:hypothetical protein [Gaiellales bacterium]
MSRRTRPADKRKGTRLGRGSQDARRPEPSNGNSTRRSSLESDGGPLGRCQASIKPRSDGSTRCSRDARHELAADAETRVALCTQHYQARIRKQRAQTAVAPDTDNAPMLLFDLGLLLLLLLAAVVVAARPGDASLPGTLRMAVVVAAAALIPGAAVLTRIRVAVPATVVALSIALSLAIDSIASLILAWSGWWHPEMVGAVVATASGLLLARDARERARRRRRAGREARLGIRRSLWPRGLGWGGAATAVALGSPPLALASWAVSLRQVDVTHLGSYGLTPALPVLWFIALAIAVLGTCAALQARVPRYAAIAAGVGTIALILFGTIPALSEYPQYAWTYKHIGVTRFIESHGGVDSSADIYNRWPGFFAPAAALTSIAGVPNPVSYAGWAEVFFTWVDAVLIAAAVWTVSRSGRVAGGAAMLYVVTNWVGQSYYSPQAFAFVLALGCVVLITGGLASRVPQSATRTLGIVRALARARKPSLAPPPALTSSGSALVLILVIYGSIVASHQVSPYALIVQVALLAVVGLIRPRWVVAVMALMAIAYIVPNFGFLQQHFGFLDNFDPLGSALTQTAPTSRPVAGKVLNVRAALVLSAIVAVGGIVSYAHLARRQLARQALPLLLLGIAPYAILLGGQQFGGEGSLRAILFSSPWLVALIAWAIAGVGGCIRRPVVLCATVCLLTALFLPAFYGQTELNIIPPGEARGAQYLYSHATPGAVVMLAGIGFPTLSSNTVESGSNSPACLNCIPKFSSRMLGRGDVPAILSTLRKYAPRGYLIFSRTEEVRERVIRTGPADSLRNLERAITQSREFRLWYGDADARIYAYGPPGPARGVPADKGRSIGVGGALAVGALLGTFLALLAEAYLPARRRLV